VLVFTFKYKYKFMTQLLSDFFERLNKTSKGVLRFRYTNKEGESKDVIPLVVSHGGCFIVCHEAGLPTKLISISSSDLEIININTIVQQQS